MTQRQRIDQRFIKTNGVEMPEQKVPEGRSPAESAAEHATEMLGKQRRRDRIRNVLLSVVGAVNPNISKAIEAIMTKNKEERIKVPSTVKGIAEALAGISIIGMSQDFWTMVLGGAVLLYGAVDIYRKERND